MTDARFRLPDLEAQVTELEAALEHYAHDRESATHIAIRNQVDVAPFGAGAVIKAVLRALRQTLKVRVQRFRRQRALASRLGTASQEDRARFRDTDWVPLSPMPTPKVESSAAVVGKTLYVFTGFGPGERFDPSSWAFDRELNSWHELTVMPIPLSHAAIGVVDDHI